MFDIDFAAACLRSELEALALQAVDFIYDELPDYANVPREDLYVSTINFVRCAILALELGDARAALEATPAVPIASRYNQGVTIESAMRGGRICIDLAQRRFREVYRQEDLPLAHCLLGLELMWQVSDLLMQRTVNEYRGVAGQRRLAKLEFFRLLENDAPAEQITTAARAIGLSAQVEHVILIASGSHSETLVRELESSFATLTSPAQAVEFDAFVAAIIPAEAAHRELPAGVCAAHSAPAVLTDLPASWDHAHAVFTSIPPGSTGMFGVDRQSWRLAVPAFPELTALYRRKYTTEDAELLESVWAYIIHGRNYRRASAALFIHENTLRHRINRFTTATGADIDDSDTKFELLWLKHAVALEH